MTQAHYGVSVKIHDSQIRKTVEQLPDVTPFPWWAIIGPAPTPPVGGFLVTPHDQTRRLMGAPQVGPLRLSGGEKGSRRVADL